jgi:hypothetical protein
MSSIHNYDGPQPPKPPIGYDGPQPPKPPIG